MSAGFTPVVVDDAWSQARTEPLAAGWAGPAVSRPFVLKAAEAQRGQVRFPWMALAAVSGGLGGAVAGILAALRLAGIGG
jgi:hypothetical protein